MRSTSPGFTEAPSTCLARVASRFERASNELLQARRLLERVDAKFVLPAELASSLLTKIVGDYLLVPKPERSLAHYRTTCFDTPDLRCYHEARLGLEPHHKVRIRQYFEPVLAFVEVKIEGAQGQTVKHRLTQPFGQNSLTDGAKRLIAEHTVLRVDCFRPVAIIDFHRLTLVNERSAERVTIDLNIKFDGARHGNDLQDVAIVEVKQEIAMRETPIMRVLARSGVSPVHASKYCTTVALRDSTLPRGHVQAFIRTVREIQARTNTLEPLAI